MICNVAIGRGIEDRQRKGSAIAFIFFSLPCLLSSTSLHKLLANSFWKWKKKGRDPGYVSSDGHRILIGHRNIRITKRNLGSRQNLILNRSSKDKEKKNNK